MSLLNDKTLEIAGGAAVVAALAAVIAWYALRNRPTEEELEYNRRNFLVQSGRLVDGMLLDITEMEATDGRTLTLMIFNYRIGGVDYECSQDITQIRGLVNETELRIGYPCTVRYQPGNPQNSIVIAEGWSGLRASLPQLPHYEDPDPADSSHLAAERREAPATARIEGKSINEPLKPNTN